eukprot:g6798.t1
MEQSQAIWRTKFAFLAQLRNGNFIAWGDKNAGADISFVKTDLESVGVEAIWSNSKTFLVKLCSGHFEAWGSKDSWSTFIPEETRSSLDTIGVQSLGNTEVAFLAKLMDGNFVAWGDPASGADFSAVQRSLDSIGVEAIWSTDRAFLAKLCDQTFTAWGEKSSGADISTVKPKLDSIGVEAIWSTSGAFLAKLRDGSFLAWGDKYRGADLTTVAHGSDLVGAEGIWSTDYAFFAKLRNGNFRAWGDGTYGALITRTIENDLKKGLEAVWSTSGAFLAKLCDGSFTAWGDKDRGADISAVQDHLELLGVEAVWSTSAAFLAKLCDGSFIAWGDPAWGSWNEDLLQKEFLEWQRTGLTPLPVVRMCFVGRGRAGKTTTLRRLKGEELKEDERSTHGVEVWAGQMREDLITNVLRLGYLPRSDGLPNGKESIPGKRLFSIQPITREDDHLRAVEHDLQNYSGPHPKMMKYLKRLWERSAFLAQRGFDLDWHVNILEAIQPVFQHWVARLGAMADHVETLWYMLRDNNPKAQQKASEDIQSLRQAMNSLLEELQKKCEHCDHGFLEDLRSNLPSPFKMLSKEGAGEVIIYNAYIIALTKFVVHCKDFAYKSNPKKAVIESCFELPGNVGFRIVTTHLPNNAYGPARREFASCLARVAKGKMNTILAADLSFPDEAIHPLLRDHGLEQVEFLQIPYPTSICPGSRLPKRTSGIAVMSLDEVKVHGKALKADDVMSGLQAVVDKLNARSARAPTPVRYLSDKE